MPELIRKPRELVSKHVNMSIVQQVSRWVTSPTVELKVPVQVLQT